MYVASLGIKLVNEVVSITGLTSTESISTSHNTGLVLKSVLLEELANSFTSTFGDATSIEKLFEGLVSILVGFISTGKGLISTPITGLMSIGIEGDLKGI